MMTTNLFVIANVKQLRTYVVLEFYYLFAEHLGVLASYILQVLTVFTIGLSLGRFWKAFGISGGFQPPPPNPLSVRHCLHSALNMFETCWFFTPIFVRFSELDSNTLVIFN